jgi:hypothetical protein
MSNVKTEQVPLYHQMHIKVHCILFTHVFFPNPLTNNSVVTFLFLYMVGTNSFLMKSFRSYRQNGKAPNQTNDSILEPLL